MFGMKPMVRVGTTNPLTFKRILWNHKFIKREKENIARIDKKLGGDNYAGLIIRYMERLSLRQWITLFPHVEEVLDQMITQYRDHTERNPFHAQLESQEIYISYIALRRRAEQTKKVAAQKAWVTRRKHARTKNRRKSVGKRSTSLSRTGKKGRKKS